MPQFDISTYTSQIFWLLITFFSLWFLLSVFIIPRIENIKEQRRLRIDGFIEKAEKLNKKALHSLEQYQKAWDTAKNDADKSIADSRAELERFIADKQKQTEAILNQKIAENEAMLKKERAETLEALNKISTRLAVDILDKLSVSGVSEKDLEQFLPREDSYHA